MRCYHSWVGLPLGTPKPVVTVLPPPSIGVDCTEPSKEDSLSTPEIQLHIVTNVVSRLRPCLFVLLLLSFWKSWLMGS
jgi:hypothetical protein